LTDFKVPELGENVAGGDVTRVLVNVGDTIARDQPVLELETDKATIEVPSSVAGVVKAIAVKKGDKIKVGATVLTVDDAASGNGAGKASASAPSASASAPAATADKTADKAEATPEPKAEAKPDPQPEPQTRADAAKTAPQEEAAKVISMPSRPAASAPKPEPEAAPAAKLAERPGGLAAPASPAVRRLAREIGVDINSVQGSGPAGRISLDDVKEQARRVLSSVGSATAGAGGGARAVRPLPDFAKWGEVDRQPWSNIRRATSEHLSYAWNTIPHVTQFDKADITALDELRKKYKDQVAKAGGNLTVTAMLVRILATAVKRFPQFNASIDTERGELVFKKFVNVGVAVDTDRGLLVPVIRNADRKNIQQIAIELNQVAEKARDKKLSLEDMSGGGMTISNLGSIGGTYFTPIVNWPEVAILGVSRGAMEPVWKSNSFEPHLMLPLSLSYDHRVIDGADAMRFLRYVVEAIEQPFLLSLIG
jgi:pyruvate dehydrogenase E2 component (dihydrolipoamide acetyltransferase)